MRPPVARVNDAKTVTRGTRGHTVVLVHRPCVVSGSSSRAGAAPARPTDVRAYESKLSALKKMSLKEYRMSLKEYIKRISLLTAVKRISLLPNEAHKALQCGDLRVVTTQYYRSVARWGSGTHYYCNI